MPHEGRNRDEERQREEPEPLQEAPRAAGEFGTTADEQRRGEPLGDRLDREEPDDRRAAAPRDAGQLVGERVEAPDVEPELVADEVDEIHRTRPAEEEAVRVEGDRAPGGVDRPTDGYVEDEDAEQGRS